MNQATIDALKNFSNELRKARQTLDQLFRMQLHERISEAADILSELQDEIDEDIKKGEQN